MARTPTYLRVNCEEIEGLDPVETREKSRKHGMLLLVEDDRPSAKVPDEWLQNADKVVVGGIVVKDRDGLQPVAD